MFESSRVVCAFILGVVGLTGAACSSPSESDEPGTGTSSPNVLGVYGATSPGAIVKIAFAEGQYALVTNDCAGASTPCVHEGSYELDAASDALKLTDAITHETTTLPFAVVEARQQTAPRMLKTGVAPAGVCIVGVTCCDANPPPARCGGGQALVTPGAPTTTPPAGQLIVECTGNCAVTLTINGQTLTATGQQLNITVPAPPP